MRWKKLFFKSKIFILVFVPLFFLSEYLFLLMAHEKKVSGIKNFQGGNFTLKSTEGPFSLKDLRGSVVLLFFGYTSCPNVCPISLVTIRNVFSQMSPDELKRTKALFNSLDPEKDNLEILKQYTDYFHPNIVGLTHDNKTLTKVA